MTDVKILMLGESLAKQGGIVSVQKLILAHSPPTVHIHHIATLVDGSGRQKMMAFGRAMGELIWQLGRSNVALVHIHMSERGSAFRQAISTIIAWILRKPTVMHTHGAEFHLFYHNLPRPIQRILGWIFRRCTHFIVLSETWKHFYVEHLGLDAERVTVLANPVVIPAHPPDRSHPTAVTFQFLGRVGQRKGAFDLVQAFANLPPTYRSQARLVMAGDGEVDRLRQLVTDCELTDQVTVIEWVNPQERDRLLADAHVFVLPSYNEGLPMAILEAMSWELPVITTPVGGIPELVVSHHNGLLIPPGNIPALTMAMQTLIDDEPLRLSLGRVARHSIKVFDIRTYMTSLMSIYNLSGRTSIL